MKELIGNEMVRQRKEAGIKQYDLAAKLGVTRETLGRWEDGVVTLENLDRYLGFLGLPGRRFLEGCLVAGSSDQEALESAGRIIRRDV